MVWPKTSPTFDLFRYVLELLFWHGSTAGLFCPFTGYSSSSSPSFLACKTNSLIVFVHKELIEGKQNRRNKCGRWKGPQLGRGTIFIGWRHYKYMMMIFLSSYVPLCEVEDVLMDSCQPRVHIQGRWGDHLFLHVTQTWAHNKYSSSSQASWLASARGRIPVNKDVKIHTVLTRLY